MTISILYFRLLALGALLLLFTCSNCRSIRRTTNSRPVTHERWDALLKKHVRESGLVDYKGFLRDTAELNRYLALLESAHPDDKSWTREQQMAYWINAYNAYTIQLILRNYPVESIKDIKKGLAFVNSVWDVQFIKIQGYTYDLNNIEHNILRPVFKDARVHAAINCASASCPVLRREAYTPEKLDAQLTDAMQTFLNDPRRNQPPQLSSIFNWFSGDFERDAGSVRAFVNKYLKTPVPENTKITYLTYDWSLNQAE